MWPFPDVGNWLPKSNVSCIALDQLLEMPYYTSRAISDFDQLLDLSPQLHIVTVGDVWAQGYLQDTKTTVSAFIPKLFIL